VVEISRKKAAIIGQGYVGLPLALTALGCGWEVIGIDSSKERVEQVFSGQSPVEDVSDEELRSALNSSYEITSDFEKLQEVEIIVICVPTPLNDDGAPDLDPLSRACEDIARFAPAGALVINESTSFPGTIRNFIPNLIRSINPNLELEFAAAPERVDPANSKWHFGNTPRLVGGLTPRALERAVAFYSSFCEVVIPVSSPEVAEMSKLLENSYRQVNIALVNQFSLVAQKLKISMAEVINSASSKPYGFMPFHAGIGVGGHCIPVDPMYLSWFARSEGLQMSLIDEAQRVNEGMPFETLKRIKSLGVKEDSRILLVGISYKPRVADLRESPSLVLLDLLAKEFRNIEWWDPMVSDLRGTPRTNPSGKFDLVVLVHSADSPEIQKVLQDAELILDYTGKFNPTGKVITT
jgi:UDP-N-acetyl-D-glucosamine dehydrogenase